MEGHHLLTRDKSGALAFQKRENSVRMLRVVEPSVANAERFCALVKLSRKVSSATTSNGSSGSRSPQSVETSIAARLSETTRSLARVFVAPAEATGAAPDRDESDGTSSDVTSHRHEPR
jgi:hypothetical protein